MGKTKLEKAVEEGREAEANRILRNPSWYRSVDLDNLLLTAAAVANAKPEIVRMLIGRGADPRHHSDAAMAAALRRSETEIAEVLLVRCYRPKRLRLGLLVTAVMNRNDGFVTLLGEAGTNFGRQNSYALMEAVPWAGAEKIRLLLKYGADPWASDGLAVKLAARNGNFAACEVLIEASPSYPDAEAAAREAVNEAKSCGRRPRGDNRDLDAVLEMLDRRGAVMEAALSATAIACPALAAAGGWY